MIKSDDGAIKYHAKKYFLISSGFNLIFTSMYKILIIIK